MFSKKRVQRSVIFPLNLISSIASMKHKIRHKVKFQESIKLPLNLERLETNMFIIGGVLMERAHYYAILAERRRTIRLGVLIEGSSKRRSTILQFHGI